MLFTTGLSMMLMLCSCNMRKVGATSEIIVTGKRITMKRTAQNNEIRIPAREFEAINRSSLNIYNSAPFITYPKISRIVKGMYDNMYIIQIATNYNGKHTVSYELLNSHVAYRYILTTPSIRPNGTYLWQISATIPNINTVSSATEEVKLFYSPNGLYRHVVEGSFTYDSSSFLYVPLYLTSIEVIRKFKANINLDKRHSNGYLTDTLSLTSDVTIQKGFIDVIYEKTHRLAYLLNDDECPANTPCEASAFYKNPSISPEYKIETNRNGTHPTCLLTSIYIHSEFQASVNWELQLEKSDGVTQYKILKEIVPYVLRSPVNLIAIDKNVLKVSMLLNGKSTYRGEFEIC